MKVRVIKKRYNKLKKITERLNQEISVMSTALSKSTGKNIELARECGKLHHENKELAKAYAIAAVEVSELEEEIITLVNENAKLRKICSHKLLRPFLRGVV